MTPQTAVAPVLSDELVSHLQSPQLVLVTTLDAQTNWPTNNLITWVLAKDDATLRLVAEAHGRVLDNIRSDGRLLLTVMAGESCHAIEGEARVIADELAGMSLKLGMAEVRVRAVRNVMFHGGKLTALPRYDVTYDQATKEKLDAQVFEAMRNR